ncbi:hypothetical protein [Shouchella clausii]|uniref:hypothetical protein n=1 Tax=Shouchella clausii TaxID=79880 RepID=UPI001C73731F|nr:hypothetical protein [Shouchella clausii]MBX0320335.1 hypothetical protein [Shouchella clausii]
MGGKRITNLDGHEFGRLKVIKEVEKRKGKRYFLCECECGKSKIIQLNSLRHRNVRSCGCLIGEKATQTHTKDLTGKRFGRLVAVEIIGKDKKKNVNIWRCRCDCETLVDVRADHLTSLETQSCGCLKKEQDEKNLLRKDRDYVDGQNIHLLNDTLYKNNTSGVRGVSFEKRSGKWRAYIRVKNNHMELGLFADKQDAVKARKEAEEKYHNPYKYKE